MLLEESFDTARAVPSGRSPATSGIRLRVPLIRKLTLGHKSRFVHATLVAASVVTLVLVHLGVREGLGQTGTWTRAVDADLWATSATGIPDATPLPPTVVAAVAAVPGVRRVTPITQTLAQLKVPGQKQEEAMPITVPPDAISLDLVAGRAAGAPGEIVVDDGFLADRGLHLGSTLSLTQGPVLQPVTIVGTARHLSMLITQSFLTPPSTLSAFAKGDEGASASATAAGDMAAMATSLEAGAAALDSAAADLGRLFGLADRLRATAEQLREGAVRARGAAASLEEARRFFAAPEPTALALSLDSSTDVRRVSAAIEVLDVNGSRLLALTPRDYEQLRIDGTVAPFLGVLDVLVVSSLLLGSLVVGLVLASMVSEALPDYAVLAALGATRPRLLRLVFRQCMLVAGAAAAVGMLCGVGLAHFVGGLMPLMPLRLSVGVATVAGTLALAMGALAAVAPMRALRHLEPAALFRT